MTQVSHLGMKPRYDLGIPLRYDLGISFRLGIPLRLFIILSILFILGVTVRFLQILVCPIHNGFSENNFLELEIFLNLFVHLVFS